MNVNAERKIKRGSIFDPLLFDDVINKICFMRAPKKFVFKAKMSSRGEKTKCKPDNFDHTIDEGRKKITVKRREKLSTFFDSSIFENSNWHLFPSPISTTPAPSLHFTFAVLLCHRDFSVCDGFGV